MTRIVCRQLAPRIGDLQYNRELVLRTIRESVDAGADILVLPELITSGYMLESAKEAASVAIRPDDSLFDDWCAEAKRGSSTIIGGFCEQGDDGLLYNSAAVVDRDGVRAVYRKTHLWDREKLIFEPGAEVPPVVDTEAGRIGLLVCYDLEFPELTRAQALAGADVLVVPTNWPVVERPPGERAPEVIIAMAAARVNRVFVACCDRTGTERGQEWTAGTTIISESGWPVATADENGIAVADIDLSLARRKRLTELADAMADRRPHLYAAMSASQTDAAPAGRS
jgi:predicted amidohydrolase